MCTEELVAAWYFCFTEY